MRLISLLFILAFSLASATVIVPFEWEPNRQELEELGVAVAAYGGPVCGEAHEINISIPRMFRTAKFDVGILILKNGEDVELSSTLTINDVEETLYSEKPFYGLGFCLATELWDRVEINLLYVNGEHTTNLIKIRNLDKLLK